MAAPSQSTPEASDLLIFGVPSNVTLFLRDIVMKVLGVLEIMHLVCDVLSIQPFPRVRQKNITNINDQTALASQVQAQMYHDATTAIQPGVNINISNNFGMNYGNNSTSKNNFSQYFAVMKHQTHAIFSLLHIPRARNFPADWVF